MSSRRHYLAAVVLCLGMAFGSAGAEPSRPFDKYGVDDSYSGTPARLDTSHPIWKAVPDMVKDDVAGELGQGANFAGAYRLVTIGCGTACRTVMAIDLRSGRPHIAPLAASAEITFRGDSRLIVFEPDPTTGEPAHYLVLDGGRIVEIEVPGSGGDPSTGPG
jgi:hypothetical protein